MNRSHFHPTIFSEAKTQRSRRGRRGIVLLIVLGMLSLFTVLAVSFVVFSSQMASSSYATQERRLDELLPEPPIDAAMLQLVIGTDDSRSAAFGASLFEDFYGSDGYEMRVAHRRGPVSDGRTPPTIPGGQLLLPLSNTGEPQTTLFKIPTHLAWWHNDGNPAAVLPIPTPIPQAEVTRQRTDVEPELDDALSGRIITFEEGPLRHKSFRIVRSLGTDNGTLDRGVNIDDATEWNLAGCVVIDLSELGSESIAVNGNTEQLYAVAAGSPALGVSPNQLLYSPGPDGAPGIRGVNDDNINGVDDAGELGAVGSDDYGFRFVINGTVFNGRGINPDGANGVTRNNVNLDSNAAVEFTLNSRLTGSFYRAGGAGAGSFPEPDEAWDAPDLENIFLAWQPSDHRRSFRQFIYSGADAAELNRQLGQHLIPSFHRPSIINYLMNAPIWLDGETVDPNNPAPTFAQIEANADPSQYPRLLALATRLRRATLRPLNFGHTTDLNLDGDPFDGTPLFNGSNPVSILNRPMDLTFPNIISDIKQLANWMVNGPWDVDNDGDGLPDSLWIDLNLPVSRSPDGQLIKPMVAALIEDWDGRVNVNYAGSYNQLVNQRFAQTQPPSFNSDAEYFLTTTALSSIRRGGGVGPAEIDFSHFFAYDFIPSAVPAGYVGPIATNQTGLALGIDQVLATRYGNLLNARYGGQFYNYASPYPYPPPAPPAGTSPLANFLRFPGAGTRFNLQNNADLLARIPFPGRAFIHQSNSVSGRPVDLTGVMQTGKDFNTGGHQFTRLPVGEDIVNQPYEFGATEIRGDDKPFSPAEHIDFQRGGPLNGRLSQLLGDAADRNEALRRLLVTDSRSVDSPELPGDRGMVQFMSRKIGNIIAPQTKNFHLHRMLAVELRKGSKLNINRQIGNEQDDTGNGLGDESNELAPVYIGPTNRPNNRRSREPAFPQISADYPQQGAAFAHYNQNGMIPNIPGGTPPPPPPLPLDFDGIDTDGDGLLDVGTQIDTDGDGTADAIPKMADGAELLARHLYCLIFALIENESGGILVPDFPYPGELVNAAADAKNRYVARRLAQWAANAVDYRDVDSKCTRLRYDPNPFDGGFSLTDAVRSTVWGMERPEIEISEAVAVHDKRLKRNLTTSLGSTDTDGELTDDEDNDTTDMLDPDTDMDQFRIPQATAYVELHSLRAPLGRRVDANSNVFFGENQEHLPGELYTNNLLDLGRTVQLNPGNPNDPTFSPIWRLAVGEPTAGDRNKSVRWIFDARRLGETLVANGGRTEELNYLQPSDFWSTANDVTDEVNNVWENGLRQSAEIRDASSAAGAFVTIADPDFNPLSNSADHRIQLERFVWFNRLARGTVRNWADNARTGNAPVPRVLVNTASGMGFGSTFFNFSDRINPGDTTLPNNAPTLLQPGGYAVIGPRESTRFGQSNLSTVANGFEYNPVNNRIEFAFQTQDPALGLFRLNYHDLLQTNGALPLTPRYYEDRDDYTGQYFHQAAVLPLICESLMPHFVDTARTDWQNYLQTCLTDTAANGFPVDLGFNISAPLSGPAYYPAPTDKISPNGVGSGYPFRDGYRGYDPAVASMNLHPDVPFDHGAGTPLSDNVYSLDDGSGALVPITWSAVGTHQEARTVFLQRLADPTSPWHPVDNPYLTVDFCPIDLTTMNGEDDVTDPVDRDGDGDPANDNYFADQARTNFDGADFLPAVKMDSRRKIPDVTKDRAASRLIPTNNAPTSLAQYDREVHTHRSHLSATFSVLRESQRIPGPLPDGATRAFWPYEFGTLWTDPDRQESDDITAGLNTRYDPALTLDGVGAQFTQTLGFVNREYGFPTDWDFNDPRVGVSSPDGVLMGMVSWMDREFQSNYDVINVPAVSRTGLLPTYSPGTDRNATTPNFETQVDFSHLLGFGDKYAEYRAADAAGGRPLGEIRPGIGGGRYDNNPNAVAAFTGDRAGLEQIFDYIDVGPVWFDSQRWFDPAKIQFRNGDASTLSAQVQMFNRAVETLQPPYNYIGQHRTPGKINLNTTPDYIRKGPGFNDPDANNNNPFLIGREFLDAFEDPANPDELPNNVNGIKANPSNAQVNGDGFSFDFVGSNNNPTRLYGNGSVYRSLAYGISTNYELDLVYGSPRTMGEPDLYQQSVDTPFGRGFKAFIESRRGYSTTFRGTAFTTPGTPPLFNGNPNLDARYPTQFAGVFAPARASATGSVQRLMRQLDADSGNSRPRRTHDMGLLRPHPDFDERNLTTGQRTTADTGTLDNGNTTNTFGLDVEAAPSGGNVTIPGLTPAGSTVDQLEISLLNTGLFERPQADLHKSFRNLDRDSYFRYQDMARLSGVTTHHSNVFHVRLTLGYFVVDPTTGAVGREYINATGEPIRSRASYVIDRTIPVGFLRGRDLGAERAIIYSEVIE